MLSPDDRCLYTDALRPPAGFRFEQAVAATYSLDLGTLLTIPLHLALFSTDRPVEELLRDGVSLLEAIRRTTDRITVYAQGGRGIPPRRPHVLYGLLEETVVEVAAPAHGGTFHPKLWLIRFRSPETEEARLRLLVLSRNLTDDRCWDLALTLEGSPGEGPVDGNRELEKLLARLPKLAARAPAPARRAQAQDLAKLALHTEWELPEGFEKVRFHALGLGGRSGWLPETPDRLAVISPFVTEEALEALLLSTDEAALVSRPEELAGVDPALLERFEQVLVLAEEAELEDGEEGEAPEAPDLPGYGLHAKAYVAKRGWRTHLYVGSANATSPALVHGRNVELMAELSGRASLVGSVDDLFHADGLGGVLTGYVPEDDVEPPDPEVEQARRDLERARRVLAASGLRIRFSEGKKGWRVELAPDGPLEMPGVEAVRAWLVTRQEETGVSVEALREGNAAPLPEAPLHLLTSFVAFELAVSAADERVRFVLNLAPEGLPVEERDAAVVRDVIRNREGFLRYVLLLLAEVAEGGDVFGPGAGAWGRFQGAWGADEDFPLFEGLTRTFCREPERLEAVRRLIEQVGADGEGKVVPPKFLDLWAVFEAAVESEAAR